MIVKKIISLVLILNFLFIFSSCAKVEDASVQDPTDQTVNVTEEKVVGVEVLEIENSKNPVTLDYVGNVVPKEMIKYSLKSGGRVGKLHVEKGDKVHKGQILAELDRSDLEKGLTAAKEDLTAAQLNVKKAIEGLNYQNEMLEKMKELYDDGTISEDQFDQLKLQITIANAELEQAQTQANAAQIGYDAKLSLYNDGIVYAKQDGIVMELQYAESELYAAGYPLVIVRTNEQMINVGLSQRDVQKVAVGTKATIDVYGETATGVITHISEVPDTYTRTYNAEVTVSDKIFKIGSIAEVAFEMGEKNGIWIPMNTISSNGEDYVYLIKDGRAFKRTIELQEIYENTIKVSGIEPGELLVTSGMKNLKDGYKVKIVNGDEVNSGEAITTTN